MAKCTNKSANLPENWLQYGETYNNDKTGFRGKIFKNDYTNEIVLSFGATDLDKEYTDWYDVYNDVHLIIDKIPPQIVDARILYQRCKKSFPNNKITITGYSLGGSLGEIMGFETGERTVTFNAFGVGNIIKTDKKCENILNVGNSEDFVFMSNINNHIGNIKLDPNKSGNIIMPRFLTNFENHKLDLICIVDLVDYEKGSVKSFFDKMNNGENEAIKSLINVARKATNAFKSTKEIRENFKPEVLKGYVSNTLGGHWVTIDGNHVLIKD
mgnify:CR=1 FL=1